MAMEHEARSERETLSPGMRVLVRGQEWLVDKVEPNSLGNHAVSCTGISALVRDMTATFLDDLDTITPVDPVKTRFIPDTSARAAKSHLFIESLLRATAPTDARIHVGNKAAMDSLPYQLVPAKKALAQPRQRILIADAVGLGKTLEAGILMSELIKRRKGRRILVVTAKSMMVQFQKEMWERFTIPLISLDSSRIQQIRSEIPANANPFSYYDKVIISIDTLKRDIQYGAALDASYWDIIVIDEAQNVADRAVNGRSAQRAKLAKRLASRSDTLIMLSATPHDGRARSFASLMNMLDPTTLPDPERYDKKDVEHLYVRRFKKDVMAEVSGSFPERKVTQEKCMATAAEEEAFDYLTDMKLVMDMHQKRSNSFLFKTMLEKSLFSSPAACIKTIDERVKRLAKKDASDQTGDIDRLEGLRAALEKIGPMQFSRYQRLLQLLRSTDYGWHNGEDADDRIVIFTERIETKNYLEEHLRQDLKLPKKAIVSMDGGMSDVEQQKIVEDFGTKSSSVRILVASDVASEGLNLHYLSHRLIHFDTPWSLMVFQQRNGRIDRYGQRKQPDIRFMMINSRNAKIQGDAHILEILQQKEDQARKDIGDPSLLMGKFDVDQEEDFTREAIESGESAENKEYFPDEVKNASAPWKQLPPEKRPARLLKDMRQSFTEVINNNENDLFPAERVRNFIDGMLAALGYTQEGNQAKDEGLLDRISGKSVPVYYQVNDSDGAPRLQVLVSLSDSAEAGVLENPIEDGSGKDGTSCEEYARMLLADFDEPARWILLMGLHQIALIDRRKWNDKKCMLFDLDEIFSRHQDHVYTAMAVLLRRDSLCPNKGDSLLDTFDDTSAKNAVEVSDNLRSALRECVEILGNEVIHDWTCNKGRSIDEIDAGDLTVQALRYMYRLLFLLFIEAKPSLGYAPMKSDIYRTGYSLDSLRDIAEQMRGRMDEAGDSTYLADTLRRLDDLVFNGYPKADEDFKGLAGEEAINAVFMVPPLKAHIFDPERTALIEHAALRDSVMLRIVDLMSVTKTGKGVKRRQRISYAALGISQMGAVYEALLSYRGFIAKEKLYEVKRAKDSYDPLKVGYFVPERELDNYSEAERVRYPDKSLHAGELRTYEPGTFIYRLAGRERETSASFYTPDSLAQCLVKYALKEIEPRIHQATDILSLKICEPAMGSATFLNETINQLATMYLNRREKERVAEEGQKAAIPAERRQAELQKVKMYIADHNIYGIDLNPVAVELGEVSLWLNTICEGSFVPWFGTQLQCGNSLIGGRRVGYLESDLSSKTKNRHWYEVEPKHIGFNRSSSSVKRVYQFLTGDPDMCKYDDKTVKSIESEHLETIKAWKKEFAKKPYSQTEIGLMRSLSKTIDELWCGQIKARRQLEKATQDDLIIYGFDANVSKKTAKALENQQKHGQGSLGIENEYFRGNNLTIREKDEMLRVAYHSEKTENASEYARLKLAMDYWCSLWFWPIDQANLLPHKIAVPHGDVADPYRRDPAGRRIHADIDGQRPAYVR